MSLPMCWCGCPMSSHARRGGSLCVHRRRCKCTGWSVARPLPVGDTRPNDLRYNYLVRLGNMGCPHPRVQEWDTEEIRAHWHNHLEGVYREDEIHGPWAASPSQGLRHVQVPQDPDAG
jgi:hypothetical protein